MPIVRLQCCKANGNPDGRIFEVDFETIKCSKLVETMVEHADEEKLSEKEPPVPLTNIKAKIFEKVLQWAEHHKNDPPQSEEDLHKEREHTYEFSPWDEEFLQVHPNTLVELLMAANFLNIPQLMNTLSEANANIIMKPLAQSTVEKALEKVRELLHTSNDFEPEEEIRIKLENTWLSES